MSEPSDVTAIRAFLQEMPQNAHRRFEALLDVALRTNDILQVHRLAEAVMPISQGNLYLQQWCTFAQAYLALYERQKPDEALACLGSLRDQKDGLAPNLLARVLNGLGIVHEMNEQWDRALRCYDECREICQAAGDDLGSSRVLINQAVIYCKAQDYAALAACAQQCIDLLSSDQVDESRQIRLGKAWNQFGIAQMCLGRLEQAQAAFEQCLAIWARWGYRWGEGAAYQNLAEVYERLGNLAQAAEYYQRARDILLAVGNPRQAADAIYGLGRCKMLEDAPAIQIHELFDEALRLARAANNHEIITHVFLSRAELQERSGHRDAMLEETRHAVQTVESLRANIVLPEDRARMTASRVEAYEQMVRRLCNHDTASCYAEAFHYAEMSKSRTLIELLADRPLHPPQRVPVEWLEQEAQLRRSLHRLYQDVNASHEQIAPLEAELDQLRERIRLQDAEFVSFQTADPLTLDEVQARLPKDSALLEYFTTGGDILVFVVTPHQVNVTHLPLRVKELQKAFRCVGENRFEPLRNLTRSTAGFLHTPWILHSLYQRLIEPLGQVVQSAQILCIVPHGLLHYVPFHALYAKIQDGPHYLAEQGREPRRIVYAPSATVLFDYCQRKPTSGRAGCLALGYNGKSLTLAEEEALKVAQVTGGKSVVGSAATRALLLAEGANYRYVHLSCHGRFNATWPLSSCLTLADGTLDVTDVLRELRLNAELVCLSACETGRSHILRSDELIGLTRAFLYASTPSLLVSQWVVDEFPTRLLMERFYRELKNGSTKSEAINRAQHFIRTLTCDEVRQILLADGASTVQVNQQLQSHAALTGRGSIKNLRGDECLFAHPYYWAPFFLVGEQFAT